MNDNIPIYGTQTGTALRAERNQVLRNTYWLLALSMVPTVLGAWLGVATGLTRALSPGIGAMVFLGGAFGFMYAIDINLTTAFFCIHESIPPYIA